MPDEETHSAAESFTPFGVLGHPTLDTMAMELLSPHFHPEHYLGYKQALLHLVTFDMPMVDGDGDDTVLRPILN